MFFMKNTETKVLACFYWAIASFANTQTHTNTDAVSRPRTADKPCGFEILAFPCNQFAFQDPGSNMEIEETGCSRFKAEFPIFGKINVNGKNTAPLYKYLKSQKGGFVGSDIKWNFTKFLVGKNGAVVGRYSPITSPSKIEPLDRTYTHIC